jgi:hypothetical protein
MVPAMVPVAVGLVVVLLVVVVVVVVSMVMVAVHCVLRYRRCSRLCSCDDDERYRWSRHWDRCVILLRHCFDFLRTKSLLLLLLLN